MRAGRVINDRGGGRGERDRSLLRAEARAPSRGGIPSPRSRPYRARARRRRGGIGVSFKAPRALSRERTGRALSTVDYG